MPNFDDSLGTTNGRFSIGGSGGVRLKNNSGELQVRNAADNTFNPILAGLYNHPGYTNGRYYCSRYVASVAGANPVANNFIYFTAFPLSRQINSYSLSVCIGSGTGNVLLGAYERNSSNVLTLHSQATPLSITEGGQYESSVINVPLSPRVMYFAYLSDVALSPFRQIVSVNTFSETEGNTTLSPTLSILVYQIANSYASGFPATINMSSLTTAGSNPYIQLSPKS